MKKFKNYVFAAMFAALVLMATAFMPIKLPAFNGYIHIGDTLIYLACCFLPFPFSILCAGVGAGLADVVTGYMTFAPFTFVIKILMALCLSNKGNRILTKRNLAGIFFAGLINVAGYYVAEMILFRQETILQTATVALASIFGNVLQSVASAILFVIIGLAFDKMNFKKTLEKI